MSICRLLLLALLSAYQHHTKLADRSQLIIRVANRPGKYRTVSNPTQCGVDQPGNTGRLATLLGVELINREIPDG